ncbi:MAG: ribosome maturation factor RimM [Desulfobacterales bacterium]
MKKGRFLPVGKIVAAHGVKGTLRVFSYVESLSVFRTGNRILVKTAKAPEKVFKINWIKEHTRGMLLSLEGITDRDQAGSLIGSDLLIGKKAFADLETGVYYWFDIIGLSVFTADERYLGQIDSIMPTGSNDVYVVKDPEQKSGSEIMIPALESVVLAVDLEKKIMRVDLPEGLL